MTITDDMIERAMRAWKAVALGRQHWTPHDAMRAALTAALASQPAEAVAWMTPDSDCQPVSTARKDDLIKIKPAVGNRYTVPLYAAPQPATPVPKPYIGSLQVNDACWAFVEAMPHRLPGPIWNDLKTAVHAAICKYIDAAPQPARVPLTDEQIDATWDYWFAQLGFQHPAGASTRRGFARAIERAHGITLADTED